MAWVSVVRAGIEGGGISVLGRQPSDGSWSLRLSTTSMTLVNDDMDEEWVGDTRAIGSLAEAFEGSREWFGALVPMDDVHPAFRQEMLAAIEELQPSAEASAYSGWTKSNRRRWLAACGLD